MNVPGRTRIQNPARILHILCALAVACSPLAAQPPTMLEEYVIGVEDVLQLSMPDHPELSVTVPVRPDGRVSLPLVDDVRVAGLTPMQLKERLLEAYKSYVTVPNLSVLVTEVHSLKVYVLGEVKSPGEYDLQRRTRVLQLVAMAGGFSEYASKDKVILLRESKAGQVRMEINLKRVYSGDEIDANFLLQPGDTVVVP